MGMPQIGTVNAAAQQVNDLYSSVRATALMDVAKMGAPRCSKLAQIAVTDTMHS